MQSPENAGKEETAAQPRLKRQPPAPGPGDPEWVVAGLERNGKILGMDTEVVFDDVHQRTLVYLRAADGRRSDFYGEYPGYYSIVGAMADLRYKVESMLKWEDADEKKD